MKKYRFGIILILAVLAALGTWYLIATDDLIDHCENPVNEQLPASVQDVDTIPAQTN